MSVAVGLAALTFISSLIIGIALGVVLSAWHLHRRELGRAMGNAAALALGTAGSSIPVFFLAWLFARGEAGFFDWLTRYGGGHVYPGFDELELLLGMSRPSASVARLAITTLSIQYPIEEGMRALRSRIEDCRRAGGRVVLGPFTVRLVA